TYGRIALDVSRSNPNVVYAQIEAGDVGKPIRTGPGDDLAASENTPAGAAAVPQPGAGRAGISGTPAAAQPPAPVAGGGRGGFNWCNNGGPGGGFGGRGGAQAQGPQTPPALNPVTGGIFRSEDKGKSWTHVSNCNARPMYFSQLRVDPSNDKTIYVAGLPVAKSLDGGRTFVTLDDAGGNM